MPLLSMAVSASLLEAMAVGLLPIVPDHQANRVWIEERKNRVLLGDLSPAGVTQVISRPFQILAYDNTLRNTIRDIVCNRADLYRNSKMFVERFTRLVTEYRNSTGGT
jgi:hypothetical protein